MQFSFILLFNDLNICKKKTLQIYDYGGHWGLSKPKNWTQVHINTKVLNYNDNALVIPF